MLFPIDEVGHHTDHVHITIIGIQPQHITTEQQDLRRVVGQLLPRYLFLGLCYVETPLLNNTLQKAEGLLLTLFALWLFVEFVFEEDLLEGLGLGFIPLAIDGEKLAFFQAVDYCVVVVGEFCGDVLAGQLIYNHGLINLLYFQLLQYYEQCQQAQTAIFKEVDQNSFFKNSKFINPQLIIKVYVQLESRISFSPWDYNHNSIVYSQIPNQQNSNLQRLGRNYVIYIKMLQEERKKVSFDVTELSNLVYGSPEGLHKFLQVQKIVSNDPILRNNPEHIQLSRKEIMENMAKKLIRFHQLFGSAPEYKRLEGVFFNEQSPLSLHYSMFMITLRNLCTDKQKKMFLEPAERGEILGCYAQTELGHGSDVQNLETTATYDRTTESFIINSPTVSSLKWWIGDLGVFANHAVLNAQLIIDGKKYGPAMFVVRIRDDQTHLTMPGVEAGDIGPKYGFNAKDNGYVKFTNYRIPRENMLMKYMRVSKEGEFERRGNERVSYATMLTIRSKIPRYCFEALSKATQICTRYSLIRKQFKNEAGNEVTIFDYQLQQQKVIPYIAETYATFFAYNKIGDIANDVLRDVLEKNEFGGLNPTHALSSGIKAVITTDTVRAMEVLRRSAGGHGFSSYSGLPMIQTEIAPTATYEGENSVLLLQTARFLNKEIAAIKKGKPLPPTVSFLGEVAKLQSLAIPVDNAKEFSCPEIIRRIFMHNAYFKINAASTHLMRGITSGLSPKQSWDQHSGIMLAQGSTAFIYYWIFKTFMEGVMQIHSEALRAVMNKLLCLYGVCKILDNAAGFYEGKVLDSNGFRHAFAAKEKLLAELRPEALGLVEAFAYDDNTLSSALGRHDGKAYETLFDWAKNHNRVNKPEVQKEFADLMIANKKKLQLPKL